MAAGGRGGAPATTYCCPRTAIDPASHFSMSDYMQLAPEEVHLWLLRLDYSHEIAELLYESLSDDERFRVSRLVIPRARKHFVAARSQMRQVLGRYLSVSPQDIEFIYGPHGKPELRDAGTAGIRFNLSHSGELALLAVNLRYPVGVDIEMLRPDRQFLKLAERFFSDREFTDILSLPDHSLEDGFYACWTRKEAYIKAVGTGFATPLNAFDVTLKPDDLPALVGQRLDSSETLRWRILDIAVPAGYRAAVASQWESPRAICRQWPVDSTVA